MEVSVNVDADDGQVLSVYVRIRSGDVHRTVVISEGECNADEDQFGNLLGVEMLAPGKLNVSVMQMSKRYEDDFESVLNALRSTKELAI